LFDWMRLWGCHIPAPAFPEPSVSWGTFVQIGSVSVINHPYPRLIRLYQSDQIALRQRTEWPAGNKYLITQNAESSGNALETWI
jgi:hypothetical protein